MALKKASGKTSEPFYMAPQTQNPVQQLPTEFIPQQPQNLGFQPQTINQFIPQDHMFNQFPGMHMPGMEFIHQTVMNQLESEGN